MSIVFELALAFLLYYFIIDTIFGFIWFIILSNTINKTLEIIRDTMNITNVAEDLEMDLIKFLDMIDSLITKLSSISNNLSTNNFIESIIAVNDIKILKKEFTDFTMTKIEKRDSIIQDILN